MKKLYVLILFVSTLGCIKKQIEEKQEDLLVQAMTNGQWKVTGFTIGSTDITSDFSLYKFQFKSDLTVDAINNGAVEKTGSWDGNMTAQSITSNFTNASSPVLYLNGTWNITSTTWTSVQASQTVSGEIRILRLDKQ